MQLSNLITNLPPYHFASAKKKIAERQAAGVDVINLSMGDPDLPAPQVVLDRLCSTLQNPENTRYPEYWGCVRCTRLSRHGSSGVSTCA